MIIGHIGIAFAARRAWPRVPMVVLLVATFLPDLLRLPFIVFGVRARRARVRWLRAPVHAALLDLSLPSVRRQQSLRAPVVRPVRDAAAKNGKMRKGSAGRPVGRSASQPVSRSAGSKLSS